MGAMSMHAGAAMSMWTRMPGQTWPGFAVAFLGMWMTMMVPMMIPPFAIALWRNCRAAAVSGIRLFSASSVWAGLGYFGVWSVIGVAILPVVAMVSTVSVAAPGTRRVIGIAACAVQLAQWTTRLVRACRDVPAVKGVLRGDNPETPWRYGVCLGLHCARNCAPLMTIALAFTGMDFPVMAVATSLITAERLAPLNGRQRRRR